MAEVPGLAGENPGVAQRRFEKASRGGHPAGKQRGAQWAGRQKLPEGGRTGEGGWRGTSHFLEAGFLGSPVPSHSLCATGGRDSHLQMGASPSCSPAPRAGIPRPPCATCRDEHIDLAPVTRSHFIPCAPSVPSPAHCGSTLHPAGLQVGGTHCAQVPHLPRPSSPVLAKCPQSARGRVHDPLPPSRDSGGQHLPLLGLTVSCLSHSCSYPQN